MEVSGIANARGRLELNAVLVRLSGILVIVVPLCSWAIDDDPFLVDEALATAFAGATLIGSNWAEYYAPDGTIVGKVRHLGLLRDFTGKWSVRRDQSASSTAGRNTTRAQNSVATAT